MHKIRMGIVVVFMVLLLFSSGSIGANSETEIVFDSSVEACEALAIEVLPESIELRNDGGKSWVYYGDQQWTDGTLIESFGVSFKSGEGTGQNPDYYYIEVLSKPFSYSKKIISRDGTRLLGTRSFSIRPVLMPLEETEEVLHGASGAGSAPDYFRAPSRLEQRHLRTDLGEKPC